MRTPKLAAGLVLVAVAAVLAPSPASARSVAPTGGSALSAPKVVRQVKLTLPTQVDVGDTVTGYAQVVDVDGKLALPVPGVKVIIQMQRPGAAFVPITTDTTDAGGVVSFSFTARTNLTWRAVYQSSSRTLASKTVTTKASLQATWGARPDTDVVHGRRTTYTARVEPALGTTVFQYARAGSRLQWISSKPVSVRLDGIAAQRVAFPKAGHYLVRAVASARATNAPGYTSAVSVDVS